MTPEPLACRPYRKELLKLKKGSKPLKDCDNDPFTPYLFYMTIIVPFICRYV